MLGHRRVPGGDHIGDGVGLQPALERSDGVLGALVENLGATDLVGEELGIGHLNEREALLALVDGLLDLVHLLRNIAKLVLIFLLPFAKLVQYLHISLVPFFKFIFFFTNG